ncbi:Dynamin family-domain-containing protein [Truncatella angustata]|uniref:Dynamin family-domain-containing protein n=1 Tax=Truncatella angustata TaxID=152316 RepID=A0A9P8UKP2_9PEZI|nr:Dynamin family-domain-containing protein [Truncatella angustata]KAH6654027.1 Dynamin family-domain-containing protein [Truncatella angustata]
MTRHIHFNQLEKASAHGSLNEVEQYASVACKVIDKLNTIFGASQEDADASRWIKFLSELKARNKPAQVIIGVVGNTGAGKSSVINAILDEERLVPTSCFRACTAVITELSYNNSMRPEERYRGEIEFITEEDWDKELEQLKDDLMDSKGNVSHESSNGDTEAGVAWAKIKAVYPHLTKKDLSRTDLNELSENYKVRQILGTTKIVSEESVETFSSCLQQYIDSTEGKPTRRGRPEKDKTTGEHKLEYWPLIKVVRIYTKAHALSTGAKIVDLPGVHDSNAARAAVADKYIEQCSGLWVVAPISRAVSDKTAQKLLGETFKLQMKYDGSFSTMAFIASKTDDISISEAMRDLDFSDEIEENCKVLDHFEETKEQERNMKRELDKRERILREEMVSLADAELKIDIWQKLAAKQEHGEVVYLPCEVPQKRSGLRQSGPPQSTTKKVCNDTFRPLPTSSYGDRNDDDCKDDDESESPFDPDKQPMSRQKVQSTLKGCQTKKTANLDSVKNCEEDILCFRKEHKFWSDKLLELQPIAKAICIRARNNQSRGAIREDFARGVKEADQDNIDEDKLDPEDDMRDHAEVAASLPVFCVSSTAYQTLSGRFRGDGDVPGFDNKDITEIPKLQQHAILMTEKARANAAKKFLNAFVERLNSLSIWARDMNTQVLLSDGEKKVEMAYLQGVTDQLLKSLVGFADKAIKDCERSLAKHLFSLFESASEKARVEAPEIAANWGKKAGEGGMYWSTYKATCRRDGSFSGSLGYRNFNEELIQPLKFALANAWERVFAKVVPQILEKFSGEIQHTTEQFHSDHKGRLRYKINANDIAMLDTQNQVRCRVFKDMVTEFRNKINALQRGANREFTPAIVEALDGAYVACVAEYGIGSFMRMKEVMQDQIQQQSDLMFEESCDTVEERLLALCSEIKQDMYLKIHEIVDTLSMDYELIILGQEISSSSKVLRSEVQMLLSEVDDFFKFRSAYDTTDDTIDVKQEDDDFW